MTTRFTVIIPTRERCDTLEWALKTCVTQDYDNFEIIVSDNASTDKTKEVVHSFSDPRIRYLNTGRRVSMSENFEFALSHATEGFIGFIGDDDGLLPNALKNLAPIIEENKCQAIIWPQQIYYWPTFFRPQLANTLSMNLFQYDAPQEVKSEPMLQQLATFKIHYNLLPSFYFGFVHHDVIKTIMNRSGTFFHSIIPDIYSAVAIACVLDSYHISSRAFSLAGQSKHSNGASQLSGQGMEAARFVRENTIPFHNDLVEAPSVAILIAESLLQVREHLGCKTGLTFDMRNVIKAALTEQNLLFNPDLQKVVSDAIREIAFKHGLTDYAEEVIQRARSHPYRLALSEAARSIFVYDPVFDCSKYGSRNIYDASIVFEQLQRKYRPLPMKYLATFAARTGKAKRIMLSALMERADGKIKRATN